MEQTQQPAAPREVLAIEVKDDLLSVELENAEFGKVLRQIGEKKGFKVEVKGDVAYRKLSTTFRNVDLERGVQRLLTLVQEKNYSFHFDSAGALNFVDVFGGSTPSAAPGRVGLAPMPTRPVIQRAITAPPPLPVQPITGGPPSFSQPPRRPPVPVTTFRRPAMPAAPVASPAPQDQPYAGEETIYNEQGNEEEVQEVPYIPAQTRPVYIPPRTR